MPSWKKVLTSGSDGSLSSLYVANSVTASIVSASFVGDGSGLTGIIYEIGDEASFSQEFTNQTSVTVIHALNSQYPFVQVYESGSNEQIIPLTVKVLDSSSIQVQFIEEESGWVVVAKGGHIVQGTAENTNLLNGQPASYYLDYTNLTNIPSGLISGSSQLTSSYDNRYIISGSITAGDWNTLLNRPSGIVSSSTQIIPLLPTGTVSGSSQVVGILSSLNSYTSSNDTINGTQNSRLDQLSTVSGSAIGRLNNIETFSGSINTKFTTLSTYTASIDTKFSTLATYTGSNDTLNTTQNNRLDSLSTFTGSTSGRLNNIESFSGSVNTKFSTLATYTGSNDTLNTTQNSRLDQLSTESGSIRTTLNSYTSSNNTLNTTQNSRLDSLSTFTGSAISRFVNIEAQTSSYARTNTDNNFSGTQTFNNIVVNGTASFAYIESVTGSAKIIGDSKIILNVSTPAERFGGISVIDSGSTFATSSLLYDGLENQWIFQHTGIPNSGSSILIFGPLSTAGLGTEVGLTQNRIPKAVTDHGHHLNDSNITDSGTLITLGSNTVVTGTIVASGTTIVSSSSQISYTGLSNIPSGIVSASSQVVGILTSLNSYTASNDTTNTTQNNRLDSLSTFTGSVSGRLNNIESFTSSINTTIKGQLDSNTVISGSSQLTSSYDLRYALSGSVGGGGGSGEFYTLTNTPFRSGSNTDVDSGTEAVITIATGSFTSAFFDYAILSGSNSRAGTVVSVWNGNTIEYAETSTKSIGNTTPINLSVTLSSGNVVLNATTTTDNWIVKALARML